MPTREKSFVKKLGAQKFMNLVIEYPVPKLSPGMNYPKDLSIFWPSYRLIRLFVLQPFQSARVSREKDIQSLRTRPAEFPSQLQ